MKILICGKNGQVGSDCTALLRKRHQVFAPDEKDLDIVNRTSVLQAVSDVSPEVVLNCAAFTNVDGCEKNQEEAWKVNVEGTGNLAQAVNKHGGTLVHLSTDYVFNGRKSIPDPYTENDTPDPLSHYGRTKLEGELMIQRSGTRHLIIRTAWVYGISGQNFLKTILKRALNAPREEIKIVADQFGSPTWSYHLSGQIQTLIENNCRGIYHASADGYCTWHELARYFLQKMEIESTIVPCSTEEYPTPAVRPRNSILENRRLKEEGLSEMPHWRDGIDQFVRTHRKRLLGALRNIES